MSKYGIIKYTKDRTKRRGDIKKGREKIYLKVENIKHNLLIASMFVF